MNNEQEVIVPEVMAHEIQPVAALPLAKTLAEQFVPLLQDAEKWTAQAKTVNVTSADQIREIKLARELRLNLRRIRCDAENRRKDLKASLITQGKAIDGAANIIKGLIEPAESHLEEQERFVEREQARIKAELASDRAADLADIGIENAAVYNLGEMSDDQYAALYDGLAAAQKAKQEAERKAREEAEAKAKAEAAERERLRAENERLRIEREASEKQAASERAKAAEELRKTQEKARKEHQAAEAKAAAEREAREKAERELIAKQKAEEYAMRQKEEAAAKLAAAPDREKLLAFAAIIGELKVPSCETKMGKEYCLKITKTRNDWKTLVEAMAEQLK